MTVPPLRHSAAVSLPARSPGRPASELTRPAETTPAQGALARLRADLVEWILRNNGRVGRNG